MKQQTFCITIFTRADSDSADAIRRALQIIERISGAQPEIHKEPYDKLGLYSERIRVEARGDAQVIVEIYDAFRAVTSTGWADLSFDEDFAMRSCAWDDRRSQEVFLAPSVTGAFLDVEDERLDGQYA